MSEQNGEKTEQATPHRLREAREQGNVSKSPDINAMAIIAVFTGVLFAMGDGMVRQLALFEIRLLAEIRTGEWSVEGSAALLKAVLVQGLAVLGPLLLALVVTAIAVNIAQTGPVLTGKPFTPDPNRFNPVQGIKRMFSIKTLFDTAKSSVKLALLLWVVYLWIKNTVPGLMGLSQANPKGYPALILQLCGDMLVKLSIVLLILALADFAFTRWKYMRDMRMSKQDIKDDYKRREGDPRIRGRIRQLRRQMLKKSQSMGKVRDAHVLITNPTHIAIAISYEHGVSPAPQVVAKGAGVMARRMRDIAGQYQIPVVQNVTLARALYREVDFDGYVPEKWFPQVAKILIWVYAMRQQRARQSKE